MSRARDFSRINTSSPTFNGIVSASALVSTNNLTVDTNTLHVDAANNRVGVGTTSPTQALQVQGITYLNGSVILGREDAVQEGSQISFARSTDNAAYWNLDVFGNASNPSFRFHNEGTVKLNIDSSGRVTIPNQPMFYAYGGGTQAWSGTATMKTVELNATYNNIGSHFNTSTYIFTAPIAGTYIFFARAATTTATSSGPALHVNVNNGAFAPEVAINYSNQAYTTFFGSMIRTLAANDNVRLSITNYNNTSFTVDQGRCSLSGYLLG